MTRLPCRAVDQPPSASVHFESDIVSLRAAVGSAFYKNVRDRPVQLRGTLFFTLYGNQRRTSIPLQGGPVPVNGVGLCSSGANFVLCSSASRAQPNFISIRILQDSPHRPMARTVHPHRIVSYSPFPVDLSIDPINQFFPPEFSPVSKVALETKEPLSHLRRDFEFNHVRLGDFESHPYLVAIQ